MTFEGLDPIDGDRVVTESDRIGLLIRAADELRNRLGVREREFQALSRAHNSRGRRHFVYAILDEVEQVAISLLASAEGFAEEETESPNDEIGGRILRNTLSALYREQALHLRRLTEILVTLMNFTGTNSNGYYDHYLLYAELEEYRKRKNDLKDYFNCENLNMVKSIDLIKRSISTAETGLQLSKCWYLAGSNPKANGGAKPATFADCFESALSRASRAEHFALGFSYGKGYGEPSRAIHLNIGGLETRFTYQLLRLRRTQICLVALHCLNRCRRLLRIRSRGDIGAEISRSLSNMPDANLLDRYTRPQIRKGDFVSFRDFLCEVLGSAKSKFGYKCFKVRYLSQPPIPEQTEDWFPATDITKQFDLHELRSGILDLLTSTDGEPPRLSGRLLRRAIRTQALDLWNRVIMNH